MGGREENISSRVLIYYTEEFKLPCECFQGQKCDTGTALLMILSHFWISSLYDALISKSRFYLEMHVLSPTNKLKLHSGGLASEKFIHTACLVSWYAVVVSSRWIIFIMSLS